MTAWPILDTLDDQPDVAADLAGRLAEDLLAEARTLDSLDGQMYPATPDAAGRQRSRLIFDAWRRWIFEAESLLARVDSLQAAGSPRFEELRRQIAMARCLVKLPLERVEHARQQAKLGETVSGEEVRRELRLSAGSGRSD